MAESVEQQTINENAKIFPTNAAEWKNYLSSPETDLHVYEDINSLRQEVESQENWTKTKELAKQELEDVPETIIPQIFERLKPYLETLPGGHSKNHIYRDFINSLIINNDPWVKNLDNVERFVGIMGGTFHDIGNSVVSRYEETKRFAGHAETGAFLFGEITEDLLSPNLLKLCQLAIAAHTHYVKDIEIKRTVNGQGKNVTKKPYSDTLDENGNKAGIWLSRWADRLDAQGVQEFIRHAITKAEPTEDYDPSEGFHKIKESEAEDFIHHFSPTMRTKNFTGGKNILEHITMYRNSALLRESIHSQHDTPYFTDELVKPNAKEQEEFIREVLKETPILSGEGINKGFEIFYAMCRHVDGGSNIEAVIDLYKRKFPALPKDQLSHWANGFSVLPRLYDQMLLRMENKLQEANSNQNQSGVFREANKFALQILEGLKKAS